MEEMITENIVPMNFGWRAGIGTNRNDISQANFQNQYQQQPIQRKKPAINKSEFYQSLIGETYTLISNLCKIYSNRKLTETELLILKGSVRNKIIERFGGYKDYMDLDLLNYINAALDENEESVYLVGKDYIISIFSELASNHEMYNNDLMIND